MLLRYKCQGVVIKYLSWGGGGYLMITPLDMSYRWKIMTDKVA